MLCVCLQPFLFTITSLHLCPFIVTTILVLSLSYWVSSVSTSFLDQQWNSFSHVQFCIAQSSTSHIFSDLQTLLWVSPHQPDQKSFHVDHWGPIINADGRALRVNWLSYIKQQRLSLELEAEVQFKVTVESPMACQILTTNRQMPTSFVMDRILTANQQTPPHFAMPSLDGDL